MAQPNLSRNDAFIAWFEKQGYSINRLSEPGHTRDIQTKTRVDGSSLRVILKKQRGIGPDVLARFYLAYGDPLFAPRTQTEKDILMRWAPKFDKDPKSFADLPLTACDDDPRFDLNRVLIELYHHYRIGPGGPMLKSELCRHLMIARNLFDENLFMRMPVGTITKAKLYLGFADKRFAPQGDSDRRAVEKFRGKIKVLHFVKTDSDTETPLPASQQLKADQIMKDESKTTPEISNETLLKLLRQRLGLPEIEKVAVAPRPNEQEVTIDNLEANVDDTLDLTKKLISRIQGLARLEQGARKEILPRVEKALMLLLKTLLDLILNVRAFHKTSSYRAFQTILDSERQFLSGWTDKDGSSKPGSH